ncbi:LOG family protein [Elizabethkingia anophelis]|uniref:LOG family protein n=1 Tax=Elizabethkingia anophelis TaxID=1117645 RepID=UPI00389160E3
MDRKINRITVFCGSSFGTEAVYEKQAYELGVTLAKQNIGLVYGGANVGLMGAVANGVIENGGEAIGVLNINGFYTELLAFVQTMVSKGFLKEINKEMLLTSDSTDELLNMMKNYKAPEVNKWIHKEEI